MNRYISIEEVSEKLKEMGHSVTRMNLTFNKADSRVWGINVSSGERNILVFYYKNREELNDHGFDVIERKKYLNLKPYELYEAVDQIVSTGRYSHE